MKDDRLEKQFEEYFKGVNIPNDITADAKAQVKPKRKIMPRIVKFASIAASIVLVFAVAMTVMFKNDLKQGSSIDSPQNGGDSGAAQESPSDPSESDPPSGGVPDFSEDDSSRFVFYTDSDLTQIDANVYTISSLDSSLKLIENFALADNANVVTCKTAYKDGKLALVTAEVNILSGLTSDETTIYVEFTDNRVIYSELADYYGGNVYSYGDALYYLTSTIQENGEPEFKLHILYNGVKYYFSVHSSDKKAYEKYLNLVTGK